MPELPEVESVRRRLRRALRGRRIVRVEAVVDPIVFGDLPPEALAAALRGRTIEDVRRKGKHLWFVLDRRPWPLFHFGMTGWLHVDKENRERRFQRFTIEVDGGIRAVFTDPRRFGRIRLQGDPLGEPPLSLLGYDVLDELPPLVWLRPLVARRQAPIKALLLDQTVFAGIGNWIADEVLYQARIRPDRAASSLSPAEVGTLRRAIVSVVRRAVAVDADSDRFPRSWLFHHRWGRNADAVTRRGERIVHATIGGRTTAWVPTRQR